MKFAMNMNVTMIVMDLAGREWPDSLPAETTNLVAHVTHFDDFVI